MMVLKSLKNKIDVSPMKSCIQRREAVKTIYAHHVVILLHHVFLAISIFTCLLTLT